MRLIQFYPTHFDILPSTNSYCINLIAKSNPINGTVISTYNQSSGKGQIGRKWFSDENTNITTSVILYPHFLSLDKVFYLNIVLSLAIRSVLERYSEKEMKIKWPNDIYYNNKKIAGLLIQQTIQGKKITASVFGYGVNINQDSFPDDLPNPISLYNIIYKKTDLDEIQDAFLQELKKYYNLLVEEKFLELKVEYLNHLYGRGEKLTFQKENDIFEAEILGITAQGKLSLNHNGRIENYELNEISYIIS